MSTKQYQLSGKQIFKRESTKIEIDMLSKGHTYQEVGNFLNVSRNSVAQRNNKLYHIDIINAFRAKIEREGFPNELNITNDFGLWFSGLFDGEGSFAIRHAMYNWYLPKRKNKHIKKYAQRVLGVSLSLRDDDGTAIKYIQQALGGYIEHHIDHRKNRNINPAYRWRITDNTTLVKIIIPLFNKYTLRTKKAREYIIWKPLVLERHILTMGGNCVGRRKNDAVFEYEQKFIGGTKQIQEIRRYTGPDIII